MVAAAVANAAAATTIARRPRRRVAHEAFVVCGVAAGVVLASVQPGAVLARALVALGVGNSCVEEPVASGVEKLTDTDVWLGPAA